MNQEVLAGKKLLILGATANEISLVQRAQGMGIYVIATDNNIDHTLSPAKDYADEYWDISWSDIDALEKKCKENNIDGITAGYSEFRIENLIRLCERLQLPCYCTMEQLDITRDKIKFKEQCRKSNVPTVREYNCQQDVRTFPVIVKPVDRAGSIGITIATNTEELEKAVAYATSMSPTKSVIIEDFVEQGIKFDVYYGVEDGNIEELSVCDTINAKANGYERVVQSCWLYPSKYEELFHQKVDASLRKMISDMGIRYGCIFFSGFVTDSMDFVFFECGFRLEGAHQYNYVEQKGPYNFNDMFIIHALTGEMKLLKRKRNIDTKLKNIVVNIFADTGIIAEVSGLDRIAQMENLSSLLMRAHVGQVCTREHAILTKVCQFAFCSKSPMKLKTCVEKAYQYLEVRDDMGNDMIYDRVDTEQISEWWDIR